MKSGSVQPTFRVVLCVWPSRRETSLCRVLRVNGERVGLEGVGNPQDRGAASGACSTIHHFVLQSLSVQRDVNGHCLQGVSVRN